MGTDDDTITMTAEHRCPACEKPLNALGGPGTPDPDCLSVCAYCLTVLVVGPPLRRLTLTEWDALDPETRADVSQMRTRLALHWPRA